MRSNDRLGLNCAFSTRKLIVADVSPDCHSYASDKCLEYALDRDKFAKRVLSARREALLSVCRRGQ